MILKPGSGLVAPALGKSGGSWEFQAILAYPVKSYLRKEEIKMKSNEDEEITVPSKQNVLLLSEAR